MALDHYHKMMKMLFPKESNGDFIRFSNKSLAVTLISVDRRVILESYHCECNPQDSIQNLVVGYLAFHPFY